MKENLKKFKKVKKKIITEALYWHKNAIKSIRVIYTKTSRNTI